MVSPGGHIGPGEVFKEAIKRKAKEEFEIEAEFLSNEPLLLTVNKTVENVAKHTDVSL
ncbi:NUDIX domain-containing protein [Candidatus Protochlamydia amoebophila]|uniref:NUDIX domain-containing protein n=1 Tax=Candidatus Protochlamydia amoebophila TaxID=362787 RepID=UPI003B968843